MYDVELRLPDHPGALATMGEALGNAEVSIEGGGAFTVGDTGIAHFLFADAEAVRQALRTTDIEVVASRPVVIQKLKQDVPGQLGMLTRMMADAGVNIEVLYSDHRNQLILVVDNYELGQQVSRRWAENVRR